MQTNKQFFFVSLLTSLNVLIPQIAQKDDPLKTTPPKNYNVFFLSSKTQVVPEETACVKKRSEPENYKVGNLTSKLFQKNNLINIKTPPFKTSTFRLPSSYHRWELPGNCPVFTVVMVIYHYVERIWRILVPPIF